MTTSAPQLIKISEIKLTDKALREVNKEGSEYQKIAASVKEKGILTAISVRKMPDGTLELIDGRHRITAADEAGHTEIAAVVFENMSESDHLESQIVANVARAETKPVQYAKQINRLLALNQYMTTSELAKKLGQTPQWINQITGLRRLDENIAKYVDDGTIGLSNGIALSRLPLDEQANYFEAAQTEKSEEFLQKVAARLKEIKDIKKSGGAREPQFTPTVKLRKAKAIQDEIEIGEAVRLIPAEHREGFKLALKWVLSLDDQSVETARKTWEAEQKARQENKERRAAERAKKTAEEAAARAAELEAKMNNN